MDPELVDRIYECSVVPELWPGVLDELGHKVEATGGTLFITKGKTNHWSSSPQNRSRAEKMVNEGWFWKGQFLARALAARHSGFLTEANIFTREELDQEPIYRDVWRPLGIGWATGTIVPIPTGEHAIFVLTRRTERGPVEQEFVTALDTLRPHLARSVLISVRLQLERAQVASETLAALGLPALLLNEQSKVLACNSLFDSLSNYVQCRAFDRVSLKDKAADQLLRDAIATLDIAGGPVRSFPVRDDEAQAMMAAHVIPIRLSARDIFVRCAAALVLTPVTLPQAPPVELVQSLFDLTPAEARVARSLAEGETIATIASAQGVAQNTIRTHVRGVLEKTGCHRQTDVVALLTAISPARLPHPA